MATLSSPGIGSGIDINGLVTKLVAAERAPADNRLNRASQKATTQLSALGTLRGALSALQTSAAAMKTEASFTGRAATSSDPTIFTVATDATAPIGSYSVEVVALAGTHKLHSAPYVAGPSAVIGTGTLTLTSAGSAFTIDINDTNKTLAGIKDAINAAPGNDKIQASIVAATDGARLVLTARNTGAINAIRVTTTGGDGGLSALVYDPGTTTNLIQLTAAQDASVKIDGFTVTSAGNSVGGAIAGVTLNLLTAKPGTTYSFNVTSDSAPTLSLVRQFVDDYNKVAKTAATLRSFDSATGSAGPLLGDAMLRGIESSVKREITTRSATVAAPYDTISGIGISLQADGTLKLDEAKLAAALTAKSDVVAKLFGGTNGLATRLNTVVDGYISVSGSMSTRTAALQSTQKTIATDQATLDARMASVEARYRKQFNAMDTLLAQMQSTSSYLTQQLTASANIVNNSGK
jgi:flagellar hook-associated protein 2